MIRKYVKDIDVSNGVVDPAYQWDDELDPWEVAQLDIETEEEEEEYY